MSEMIGVPATLNWDAADDMAPRPINQYVLQVLPLTEGYGGPPTWVLSAGFAMQPVASGFPDFAPPDDLQIPVDVISRHFLTHDRLVELHQLLERAIIATESGTVYAPRQAVR